MPAVYCRCGGVTDTELNRFELAKEMSVEVGTDSVSWLETKSGSQTKIPFADVIYFCLNEIPKAKEEGEESLTLCYIKHEEKRRMVPAKKTFVGTTEQIEKVHKELEEKLKEVTRPQHLLVFINPFSGSGKGAEIFCRAKSIFEIARITYEEIVTTESKDAQNIIQKKDLSIFDGVVVVGGDGLFNEVINGMMCRTQREAHIDPNDHRIQQKQCILPIGIIPAGTGNMFVKMLHGLKDVTTAALHIVRGMQRPSNLYSIHQDGRLSAYSMLLMGFGLSGEIIKSSQNKKWLGKSKYAVSMLDALFKKRHSLKVKFSYKEIQQARQPDTDDMSESAAEGKEEWKSIEGDFHGIESFLVTLEKKGELLTNEFGDNFGMMFLIRNCSMLDHMTFYGRLGNNKANAFDLSYIDCVKLSACRIQLLDADLHQRQGVYINYDGELLQVSSNILDIKFHHHAISVFGSN